MQDGMYGIVLAYRVARQRSISREVPTRGIRVNSIYIYPSLCTIQATQPTQIHPVGRFIIFRSRSSSSVQNSTVQFSVYSITVGFSSV